MHELLHCNGHTAKLMVEAVTFSAGAGRLDAEKKQPVHEKKAGAVAVCVLGWLLLVVPCVLALTDTAGG